MVERAPKFLRPTVQLFLQYPFSHCLSFFVLQSFFKTVPFFVCWYLFYKFDYTLPNSFAVSNELIDNGARLIQDSMQNNEELINCLQKIDNNVYNSNGSLNEETINNFVTKGANSYALLKFLKPVSSFVSLSLMPLFTRQVVIP
ncbi:uncharacterized protein ASCRUDRAFT_26230, partial [Ascoidea rubescens DSM 1968]